MTDLLKKTFMRVFVQMTHSGRHPLFKSLPSSVPAMTTSFEIAIWQVAYADLLVLNEHFFLRLPRAILGQLS